MKRRARSVSLVVALLALGCRVSFDPSGDSDVIAAAPRLAASAADTVQVACVPSVSLRPVRTTPMPGRVTRLLHASREVLAALEEGGVVRIGEARHRPVREDGRDFAVRGRQLLALVEDRIEGTDLDGGAPGPRPPLPAEMRDVSIAIAGGALYVHSPYRERDLVVRRRLSDGAVEAGLLPVERNLALLTDVESLVEDTGIVRGDERRLAFVPWVRDPVVVLDVRSEEWTALALAEGGRGRVRVEETGASDERPCPDCPRLVRKAGRRIVRRLYAGADLDGEVLWLLRLSPPGSRRAALLRVETGTRPPSVRSWWVEGLGSSPSAVLRSGSEILVGGDRVLHAFERPSPETGAPCEASGG